MQDTCTKNSDSVANSRFKDNFILKGGLLISSMIGITERTTMDMDTTVRGIQMEEDEIVSAVKEIVAIDVEDGIVFEYKKMLRRQNNMQRNLSGIKKEPKSTVLD